MDTSTWSTPRLLTTAARLHENRKNEGLRAAGLSQAGLIALHALSEHSGITQVQLARLIQVRSQTIGKSLDRLEVRGFVERTRNKTDHRAIEVSITPAGKCALREHGLEPEEMPQTIGTSDLVLRDQLVRLLKSMYDESGSTADTHKSWTTDASDNSGET